MALDPVDHAMPLPCPAQVELATLTASDGEEDDRFGHAVSVSGDVIATFNCHGIDGPMDQSPLLHNGLPLKERALAVAARRLRVPAAAAGRRNGAQP